VLFLLDKPAALLGVAVALLVGIVVHSVVQAAVARAFGDRVPVATGRLSPDPRRHVEPFGIIVMLISGIGWNKPVPLQEPRFRGGRTGYVLATLAGPAANLLLALVGLVGLVLVDEAALLTVAPESPVPYGFAGSLLYEFAVINAGIGVLTLLPIPPLDGARLLWLYAPSTQGWRNARYQLEERGFGLAIAVGLMLPIFGNQYGLLMRIVLAVSEAYLGPIARAMGFVVQL
jgi:Zn-dependent protease